MRALPLQAIPQKDQIGQKKTALSERNVAWGWNQRPWMAHGACPIKRSLLPSGQKSDPDDMLIMHGTQGPRIPADAGGGTLRIPCLQRCGAKFLSKNLKPCPGCCLQKNPQTNRSRITVAYPLARVQNADDGHPTTATQPCPPVVGEADYRTMSSSIKRKARTK